MNPILRGIIPIIVLGIAVLGVLYHRNVVPKLILNQQFRHFQNLTGKSECKIDVVDNLTTSGLKKIQNERKSRIRNVCDMCRRNRTSMECNHVTLDEEQHDNSMYHNLLVDEIHQVRVFFNFFLEECTVTFILKQDLDMTKMYIY